MRGPAGAPVCSSALKRRGLELREKTALRQREPLHVQILDEVAGRNSAKTPSMSDDVAPLCGRGSRLATSTFAPEAAC